MANIVQQHIRLQSSRGRRQRKAPRARLAKMPMRIEREYAKGILSMVDALHRQVVEQILPKLAKWQAEAVVPVRLDAWSDELRALIASISKLSASEQGIAELSKKAFGEVSADNLKSLRRAVKNSIGLDLFVAEPGLAAKAELFASKNVLLIKSVNEKYLSDVQRIISDGFENGKRAGQLEESLTDAFGITQRRAELIARDQVATLGGQLNRARQTSAGVNKFRWRTVGDDRVRDEHEALEGEVFDWDDPPEEGIPGEAINCRCWAEPVFEDFFDEA